MTGNTREGTRESIFTSKNFNTGLLIALIGINLYQGRETAVASARIEGLLLATLAEVEAVGVKDDANAVAIQGNRAAIEANRLAIEAVGVKVDSNIEGLSEQTDERFDTVERRGELLEGALLDVVRSSARNEARIEELNRAE